MAEEANERWLESHRVDVSKLERTQVVGIGHVLAELDGLVARLTQPERAAALGVTVPRGLLFWGDPGVGKTLVARLLAASLGADVPFFEVSADELTPARIRFALAHLARANRHSVLYIDEIDNFGMTRDYGGHDVRSRQMLTAMLAALDGLVPTPGPIVIASSNRPPRQLDEALIRAGRLGFKVHFDRPDERERLELLRLFTGTDARERRLRLHDAAKLTSLATPADLRQLVEDAAALAFHAGRDKVTAGDIVAAVRRSGRIEPDVELQRDWERMAIHEAGHVAVGVALWGADFVYAVRLDALSASTELTSEILRDEDRPDEVVLAKIVMTFGGVAAEVALLGSAGFGGTDDLASATRLAIARIDAGVGASDLPLDVQSFGDYASETLITRRGAIAEATLAAAREQAYAIVRVNVEQIRAFANTLMRQRELTGPALRHAIVEAAFEPAADGAVLLEHHPSTPHAAVA
jgi:cell division protease FtsH